MPRTKEQYEEMRQATREKIQTAACRLFSKKGLTGTNVQEIADLAGISVGLLYRHYKSKEELFDELVDMAFYGLVNITERFGSQESPKQIIHSVLQEIYDDLSRNDDAVNFMVLMTQAVINGTSGEKVDTLVKQDILLLNALSALIQRGQKQENFHQGDPYHMAEVFMSVLQGIYILHLALKSDFILPDLASLTACLYTEN